MSRLESSLSSPFARDVGATVLRVALGAVFLAHAGAKAFIFTFAGTAQFFEAHGFPGWTAWPVFFAELLGGLALVAGFRTRLVALALVPVMIGALKPHIGNGWMFTSAGGGWEYVAFLIFALVTQALIGSGAFALDGARERRSAPSGRTASVVG
ncbi:DoxX family protein [Pyxidicoccus parkwayensis]|uniref:DoxX family protein n=1 Tax=Pyxidicoccus parkwayensis TaxID=2813578 RepID=A0ABX7NWW0_9BACT|nr:DoxX family protein [Pyxidicoccus parkwaysis]QSQ21889.1 DoxX family protein [Pyxidicoccus parkwaysis]